jgi:cytochrome c oxidase subunit 2
MSRLPADRQRPPARILVALALIVILGVVTVVAAVTVLQLPEPVTTQGERISNFYLPVLVISLVVFYGVTSGIIWAIARYKRQSEDEMPEQIHGSSVLEATWTVIPIIILVALFIPALMLVIDLKTPPDEPDVTVEAIGHQWWWEFGYPDDGLKIQQTPPNYDDLDPPRLVLPVDEDILIKVRSIDVVHSFSAPETLYKIQAIPGNVNLMHLKFNETGEFTGQCYQFCGVRHADMLFIFEIVTREEYDDWVSETQAAQGINPADLVKSKD